MSTETLESQLAFAISFAICDKFDRSLPPGADFENVAKNVAAAKLTSEDIARKLARAVSRQRPSNGQDWRDLVLAATESAVLELSDGLVVRRLPIGKDPEFGEMVAEVTARVVAPPGSPWALSRKARDRREVLKFFYEQWCASRGALTLVGVVFERGWQRRMRTVLVKDLRPFGSSYVIEGHLWMPYDRHWEMIEPFLQGQKVILHGTSGKYRRADGSEDYTMEIVTLKKL